MYICFLSLVICLLNVFAPPQKTLVFDIVWREGVVGTLTASQEQIGTKTLYHSSSTIEFKFIKTFNINYEYDVVFDNQTLQKADVDINYNGKQHAHTTTELKNGKYEVTKDEKLETTFKEKVTYSTISMYFEEPVGITRCYSEQEGDFNQIIDLGNHTYKKINPKGKESIFFYKNGVLEKAEVDGGIVSFEIRARKK